MSLNDILDKMQDWCMEHDWDEEFDDFDDLCNKIMSESQTYFTWNVDNDCFDIDRAFGTVMETIIDLQKDGHVITDYSVGYLVDDKMILLVEYK